MRNYVTNLFKPGGFLQTRRFSSAATRRAGWNSL
jgi:hypothetical protein